MHPFGDNFLKFEVVEVVEVVERVGAVSWRGSIRNLARFHGSSDWPIRGAGPTLASRDARSGASRFNAILTFSVGSSAFNASHSQLNTSSIQLTASGALASIRPQSGRV